jgi:diacylglycerol kinase (ATP)
MGRRIQIVVTPGSGDGHALHVAKRLARGLARRQEDVRLRTFRDACELARWGETCERAFSSLICVGGDSTISAAAAAAVRLGVPLLPVPCGFGNIFAGTFGHPGDVRRVVELLDRGEVRRVDAGLVDGEVFVAHKSYGFLAQIQDTVEQGKAQPRGRRWRHLAYWAMAPRLLLWGPLPSIRVVIDGRCITDDAVLVTVANVETYRGYLSLTPSASPTDGRFDVFVVERTSRFGLIRRLVKLMLGLRGGWTGVALWRGQHVRVHVDGRAPVEIKVARRALPLVVPRGSIERLARRQAGSYVPGVAERLVPEPTEAPRGWSTTPLLTRRGR